MLFIGSKHDLMKNEIKNLKSGFEMDELNFFELNNIYNNSMVK